MNSKHPITTVVCTAALTFPFVLPSDVDPDHLAMFPNCGWVKGKSTTWVMSRLTVI